MINLVEVEPEEEQVNHCNVSKCFAVAAVLPRVGVQTDVPCNLGGLEKSLVSPPFPKFLIFSTYANTFSSFFG